MPRMIMTTPTEPSKKGRAAWHACLLTLSTVSAMPMCDCDPGAIATCGGFIVETPFSAPEVTTGALGGG